eukprot:123338-Rhodomonas_salina.1
MVLTHQHGTELAYGATECAINTQASSTASPCQSPGPLLPYPPTVSWYAMSGTGITYAATSQHAVCSTQLADAAM